MFKTVLTLWSRLLKRRKGRWSVRRPAPFHRLARPLFNVWPSAAAESPVSLQLSGCCAFWTPRFRLSYPDTAPSLISRSTACPLSRFFTTIIPPSIAASRLFTSILPPPVVCTPSHRYLENRLLPPSQGGAEACSHLCGWGGMPPSHCKGHRRFVYSVLVPNFGRREWRQGGGSHCPEKPPGRSKLAPRKGCEGCLPKLGRAWRENQARS